MAALCTCACTTPPPEETTPRETPLEVPGDCVHGTDHPAQLRLGYPHGGIWQRGQGFEGVGARMASELGLPVETTTSVNYSDVVRALVDERIDVAILPALAYIHARDEMPCLLLVGTMVGDGEAFYSGHIVARRDSGIAALSDLRDKRIGFVESSSSSGWLFPMHRLLDLGIDPQGKAGLAVALGDHVSVLRAVVSGQVDAGATYYGALKRARAGGLDVGSLRIVGLTGRIPYDAVVIRPGIDPDLARRIAEVIRGIRRDTPDGWAALAPLLNIDGFVASTDAYYDKVRLVRDELRKRGAIR